MGQDAGLSIRERGFESRTRHHNKEPSSSSGFEGGNRPQRLGGAGTRDRMDLHWGCSSDPGRAAALQAAGRRFEPCHLHQCFVNSAVRVPACLVGSRGFESRTRRQIKFAEIAQQVERRVESACVGGSKPSLGTRRRTSLAQRDQSAGLRSRRSHVRIVHEVPTNGCVAERPIAAACKAVSHEDTVVRIHPHPPATPG